MIGTEVDKRSLLSHSATSFELYGRLGCIIPNLDRDVTSWSYVKEDRRHNVTFRRIQFAVLTVSLTLRPCLAIITGRHGLARLPKGDTNPVSIGTEIAIGISIVALVVSVLTFYERWFRPFSPKFTIGAPVLTGR